MAANIQPRNGRRGNRLRIAIWGAAALLLLLPAVAMRFDGSGVNWTGSDFVAMGVLLGSACAAYELATWLSGNTAYRAGFGLAVVLGVLTVWINLAVGMIGSEGDIANLAFAGVLLVGLWGAVIAGFRAQGMARAMTATAITQLLAGGYGMVLGSIEALFLSLFFAALWLASAGLFRKAASEQDATP